MESLSLDSSVSFFLESSPVSPDSSFESSLSASPLSEVSSFFSSEVSLDSSESSFLSSSTSGALFASSVSFFLSPSGTSALFSSFVFGSSGVCSGVVTPSVGVVTISLGRTSSARSVLDSLINFQFLSSLHSIVPLFLVYRRFHRFLR